MPTRRPPADRVDGYSPDAIPDEDPKLRQALDAEAAEAKRRAPHIDKKALDAYVNEVTGVGDFTRDKTLGGRQGGPGFELNLRSSNEARDRWRGDPLGARIVETNPSEMVRAGWNVNVQLDEEEGEEDGAVEKSQEISEALGKTGERLKLGDAVFNALKYERAYGGGVILIGADDGARSLMEPLDLDKIKTVRHLTVFRGGWDGEVIADERGAYDDLMDPKYGEPRIYQVRNVGVPMMSANARVLDYVHESRFIVFDGEPVDRTARWQMRGFGDSVFTRVDKVLSDFDLSWGGVAVLLSELNLNVLKIGGLAQALSAEDPDFSFIANRAAALQLGQSVCRGRLIDKDEEFSRETISVAGVAEVMRELLSRLAAAVDMPVSRIIGSSGGLGAKEDTSDRGWYDRIDGLRTRRLLPQLQRLYRVLFRAKDSPTKGVEPARWAVTFPALWQPSAMDKADLRLKTSQADEIDIRSGVLDPRECAVSHYGGAEYNPAITIDLDSRKQADIPPPEEERPEETTATETSATGEAPTTGEAGTGQGARLELTPSDIGAIVKVNLALAYYGLPPLTLPSGAPDPDGDLTIAQFKAKNVETIATAAAAGEGAESAAPSIESSEADARAPRAAVVTQDGTVRRARLDAMRVMRRDVDLILRAKGRLAA